MFAQVSRASALLAAGLLAAATAHAQLLEFPLPICPAPTTQAKAVLVPYQVADLVIPVGDAGTAPGKSGKPEKTATCEADLIKTIQDTIAPKSWASHGGRGTIDYFPMTMTLVINQTPDIQEQIADLLEKLRREQDTQVALEVRLVSVAEGPVLYGDEGKACLTDKQFARFLEAIQGDQRFSVMQAPKVTLLNGQMGHVDCTDKQFFVTGAEVTQRDGKVVVVPKSEEVATGIRISACPKVSADRRSVNLNLDINLTDLAPAVPLTPVTVQMKDDQGKPVPFTQYLQQPKLNTLHIDRTLTIPDGGTVLLGGLKKVMEVRTECGPPVLSKIPYLDRMFKNVGYGHEVQNVCVLVTARVIVNEEQEQRATARPPWQPAPACAKTATVGVTEESEVIAPPTREAPACGSANAPQGDEKHTSGGACCVIADAGCGQQAYCCSLIGSDTVLDVVADAMSRVKGLSPTTKVKVWVFRGGSDKAGQVMPVDWEAIVRRGRSETNYQLMSGDRLYITKDDGRKMTVKGQCQDAPCCTGAKAGSAEESEAPDHSAKALAELLKAYDEACAAGHTKEAARFARAALTLDPTCFSKARGR
jgi:hypothetical protein